MDIEIKPSKELLASIEGIDEALQREMAPTLRVINESGHPLEYKTSGAIALDLYAVISSPYRDIPAHGRWSFDTGIAIELPDGYGALVQPRSGLARDHGVVAVTGVIDRDYRGFIQVALLNTGPSQYRVLKGDRVAQLLIVRAPSVKVIEVTGELSPTARDMSGFGSTGR